MLGFDGNKWSLITIIIFLVSLLNSECKGRKGPHSFLQEFPGRPGVIVVSPGGVGTSELMLKLKAAKVNTNNIRNSDRLKHALPEKVYNILSEKGGIRRSTLILVIYKKPSYALLSLCRRKNKWRISYLHKHVSLLNVNTSAWSLDQREAVKHCTIGELHKYFESDPLLIRRFYALWEEARKKEKHGIPIHIISADNFFMRDKELQKKLKVKLRAPSSRPSHFYTPEEYALAESLTSGNFNSTQPISIVK